MITTTIPTGARPVPTANVFQSTFNALSPNRYSFLKTDVQKAIDFNPHNVYLLDKVSFSASMAEQVYQEAIDTNVSLPRLYFTTKATQGTPKLSRPFNFINYVDNQDMYLFFDQDQKDDELLIGFEGLFTQPPAIAGQLIMEIYIQFVIYEIKATDWNNRFNLPQYNLGEDIPMRGEPH